MSEAFPLRVEELVRGAFAEWRTSDTLPETECEDWQLVYVKDGVIEERCDERRVVLRQGGVLLHQPAETAAMRVLGELPPEVLRLDFRCGGAAMDRFRDRVFHADPTEQVALRMLCHAVELTFQDGLPRQDAPFGALQETVVYLEAALLLLGRRAGRARKPSARALRERRHTALVGQARLYFAQNLEREVALQEVCDACGCTRQQLQQAFRARTRHGPIEDFARMRLDYAAQLLGRGATPGEVAKQLGYCSGAYFSQRFKEATGSTPSEYRRTQMGLPARRGNKNT